MNSAIQPGQTVRVLMVTPTYLPRIGGIEKHIESLVTYLAPIGVHADIAIVNSQINSFAYFSEHGRTIYSIPARKLGPFEVLSKLTKYLDVDKYDIVHAHDPHIAGITFNLLSNRSYRKRLVLSSHGGFFHTAKNHLLKEFYWETVARCLIRSYDAVVCVSKNDVNKFKEIVPRSKLHLIENGVDFSKFNRVANGGAVNTNSFIYYGRFSANKRIDVLLNVFDELIKGGVRDVQLTLVGGTDDLEYLSHIRGKASKHPDKIKLIGFQDDEALLREISAATFFVTASEYEGFGMSTIEAMSAGKIPIVNDVAPLNGLVKNGETGYVINFSSNGVINSLREIIASDPSRRESMRSAALNRAREFCWEYKAKCYRDLYIGLQAMGTRESFPASQ